MKTETLSVRGKPLFGRLPTRQRGAFAVLAGVLIVMLLSFGALAVDLAYGFMVRSQVQNAADAAALAGAACLMPDANCGAAPIPTPNWTAAQARATSFITENSADNSNLQTGTVEAGYWNLARTPDTMQPDSLSPLTTNDVPGVMVTIWKSDAENGSVGTFFARLFGTESMNVMRRAVAVISYPGSLSPHEAIPFVLSKCLYDKYWDSANGKPLYVPATGAPPITVGDKKQTASVTQVPNEPYRFPAVSTYSIDGCDSGQWTSFETGSESTKDINGFITNGNPTELSIGEKTYISSGSVATLYQSIFDCSGDPKAKNHDCEYSQVAVVDDSGLTHSFQPIKAFACVRILTAQSTTSIKYVTMQMAADQKKCQTSGSGGGTNYGSYLPPRLAF